MEKKYHIKIEVQDWADWVNKHYQNPDMRTAIDELTLKSDSSEMMNIKNYKELNFAHASAFNQDLSNWDTENK